MWINMAFFNYTKFPSGRKKNPGLSAVFLHNRRSREGRKSLSCEKKKAIREYLTG